MSFAILRAAGLALVITGLATVAQAQTYIGYVETLGGSISSAVSFNSAGGTNSLAVVGTGRYQVTLGGLGRNSDSPTHQDNVQVNAVATGGIQGNYCETAGWDSVGIDTVVTVACFDASGQPAPADFSMFYQRRTSPPLSGAIAFMETLGDLVAPYTFYTPPNSYTSIGRLIGVTQVSTGTYDVLLRGFLRTGNPQVTPELVFQQPETRCEVLDWYRKHDATHVIVTCVNGTGVQQDTAFSLSYTSGATEAAGLAATELGAYAWADSANRKNYVPDKHRQFDNISAGPLTAQRYGGPGLYSLTVPNPSEVPFNTILGMVTAVGGYADYCEQEGLNVTSFEFYMDVVCYNANGAQVDSPYTATFITSQ